VPNGLTRGNIVVFLTQWSSKALIIVTEMPVKRKFKCVHTKPLRFQISQFQMESVVYKVL